MESVDSIIIPANTGATSQHNGSASAALSHDAVRHERGCDLE